jgi:hypothetical protein
LDDADINHLVQIEKKISNPSQMDDTLYECLFERLGQMFTFKSTGKQTIFKIVLFNPTTEPNIYSVTLGNLQDDASIDVSAKDGNGDGEFVLSTVAKAIAFFLSDYPEASIIIEGTTPIRTRLFQIAISRELDDLGTYFDIRGLDGTKLEIFQPGKTYQGFVISLKAD